MRLHLESSIEDFWNTKPHKALHPEISKHIALRRWEQIDRFFHLCSSTITQRDVFIKVDDLSEHLRVSFKRYWNAGTHLTVDESIQRFMGRSSITVNIPSKSVPEGYKIWVLANAGYVLN